MEKEFNKLLGAFEHKAKQSYEINNELSLLLKSLTNLLVEERQKFSQLDTLIKAHKQSIESDIINFNVGGKYFSILKSDILKKIPKPKYEPDNSNNNNNFYGPSLLQSLITSGAPGIKYDENKAIFIKRDPKYFNYVLNYLRVINTEETFIPPNSTHDLNCLLKESEFYRIDGLTCLLKETLSKPLKTNKLIKKYTRSRKKEIELSTSSKSEELSPVKRKSSFKKIPLVPPQPQLYQNESNLNKLPAKVDHSDVSKEKSTISASVEISETQQSTLKIISNSGNFRSLRKSSQNRKETVERPTSYPNSYVIHSDHVKTNLNLAEKLNSSLSNNAQIIRSSKNHESREAHMDALIDLYSLHTSRDKSREASSNSYYFTESLILNKKLAKELIKLCEFSLNDKWTLIYRGSTHGFGSQDFHKRCDGYAKTLTIIKSQSYIFGGFSSAIWEENDQYKSDPKAFIFSLVNKDNKPIKMKCQNANNSIYCSSTSCAVFGGGHDLYISNNSNVNTTSYSNLGHSYEHPKHKYDTIEASSFLAGYFNFKVNEIEIYYKV